MEKEFVTYHCFIAHSAKDLNKAIELYNFLSCKGLNIFLDAVSLKPGDLWDDVLKKAQAESLVTLILISNNTADAYYQKEEISDAIDLGRKLNRKVIPVYLEANFDPAQIPYGLKRVQGLHISENKDLKKISDEIFEVIEHIDKSALYIHKERYDFDSKLNLQNVLKEKVDSDFADILSKLESLQNLALKKSLDASLLFFDIDGMTQINKYHGKQVADEVNLKVQEIFDNALGGLMITHKLGTDEYIAASINCNKEKTLEYAERIRNLIANYNWNEIKLNLRVKASFGVAQLITDGVKYSPKSSGGSGPAINGESVNEWVVRAIFGCRQAKEKGGNCVMAGPKVLPDYISHDLNRYIS